MMGFVDATEGGPGGIAGAILPTKMSEQKISVTIYTTISEIDR